MSIRCAYQGEHGAYSEQAVNTLFYGCQDIVPVPCAMFSDVFEAVTNQQVDCALVPIENSLGGSIHDNYDLLVAHDVTIRAEIEFQVHHCLMALPGTKIQSLHTVMSHPQALAQTEDFIRNLGLKAMKQYDTAGSAKMITEQNMIGYAAVASKLAATAYGLEILAENIEDDQSNFTRFILISRSQSPALSLSQIGVSTSSQQSNRPMKTSVAFALVDEPGVLFKALSVFALRDIQLSKIESRPGKRLKKLLSSQHADQLSVRDHSELILHEKTGALSGSGVFKYIFYLDLMADSEETRVRNALNHLKEIAPFCRVLGSYPAAQPINQTSNHSTASVDRLRIGIVGFSTFGQFLAKAFVKKGHEIHATSRSNYQQVANAMGVTYHSSVNDMLNTKLDVLILSVSILSFSSTIESIDWTQARSCLVVDVLSVKIHPKSELLRVLPAEVEILCTHPMFGPESGKNSWSGLPVMFERVRVHSKKADEFLSLFSDQGCRMLEMACELHDAYAAGSQFITHTTGRMLAKLGCEDTPINTKGYSMLLQVIANTSRDSFDLYKGLYEFNPHSQKQLQAMEQAFLSLKQQLLDNSEGSTLQPVSASSAQLNQFNPLVLSMNESKTAQVTDLAKKLTSEGQSIISLSVGEPLDIPTPAPIIEATITALRAGHTRYTPVAGLLELRKAITIKLERDNNLIYSVDDVVVSNGAKQSIYQAILALSTPGCEIVIPAPYWVSYPDMCTLCGAKPVIVETRADTGFVLSANELRKVITDKTKAIIMCSPSNPTGGVYTREQMEEICEVLKDFPNCWVISDEIYEHLLFDDARHFSFASLPDMFDRTITVNGFSKCFAMTGFRLGYVAAPRRIAALCNKIQGQITSCASSVSQHAGIAALAMDLAPFKQQLNQVLRHKRDMVLQILRSVSDVHISQPLGAFYAMPDISHFFGRVSPFDGHVIANSDDLCVTLLKHYHVALVPGSAFGAPRTVRISYASDEHEVRLGTQALATCLQELKPKQD